MGRIARAILVGHPHHVTHRGNRRGVIFLQPTDPMMYLDLLRVGAERAAAEIWAYCLMPNHVHLIALGRRPDSLAKAVGCAHRRFSRLVHRRMNWTGHLWANRYFSTPLDEAHLWAAVRYVEANPVRAGLAKRAEDYPWSSARAHVLGIRDPLLAGDRPFPGRVDNWAAWLAEASEDPRIDLIRANTLTGRPTGDDAFTARVERELGRRLRRRKAGRPPSAGSPHREK